MTKRHPNGILVFTGDGPAIVGDTPAPHERFPDGPLKRVVFALEEAEDGLNWAIHQGRLLAKDEQLVKDIRDKVTDALDNHVPLLSSSMVPQGMVMVPEKVMREAVIATGFAIIHAREIKDSEEWRGSETAKRMEANFRKWGSLQETLKLAIAGQVPPVEPMVSLSRVREAVLSVLDDGDLYEWLEGCDAGTVIRDDQRNEVADRVLARLQQHPISSDKGAEQDGVFSQIDAAAKGYDTKRVTAELKDFFATEDHREE